MAHSFTHSLTHEDAFDVIPDPMRLLTFELLMYICYQSEKYQRELKKGAVPVPAVGMSKASLRFLCEVLLSDTCTKSISDNINAAISRLAIVRANRTVLTELIAEVVVDLAAQSQSKLDTFLSSLLIVRRKKAADDNGKAMSFTFSNFLPYLFISNLTPVLANTLSLLFFSSFVPFLLFYSYSHSYSYSYSYSYSSLAHTH